MRLCLRCRRLSPSGTAFCGSGCGAFGGARCPQGHVTPGGVVCCPVCGTRDLVAETPSLGFGCATRSLGWALGILGLRLALAHLGDALGAAVVALEWLVGQCFVGGLWSLVSLLLALKLFAWGVGLFDAELAKRIDPGPKVLPMLWKLGSGAARWTGRLLLWGVEGKALPAPKGRKGKPKEGR